MSLNLFLTVYLALAIVSYVLILIDARRLSDRKRLTLEDFVIGALLSFALFGIIFRITMWLEKRRYGREDDERE